MFSISDSSMLRNVKLPHLFHILLIIYFGVCLSTFSCHAGCIREMRSSVPSTITNIGNILTRMAGKTFDDKYISSHTWKTWGFKSSRMAIDNGNNFAHRFIFPNSTTGWKIEGFLTAEEDEKRIRWDGTGRIPGGPEVTDAVGYIYILYINPPVTVDGNTDDTITTLAYYSCWDSDKYTSNNIYISQTAGASSALLIHARTEAYTAIRRYSLSSLHHYGTRR